MLSAGAINSPQILQISGVGPADILKKMGSKLYMILMESKKLKGSLQCQANW